MTIHGERTFADTTPLSPAAVVASLKLEPGRYLIRARLDAHRLDDSEIHRRPIYFAATVRVTAWDVDWLDDRRRVDARPEYYAALLNAGTELLVAVHQTTPATEKIGFGCSIDATPIGVTAP